MIYGIIAKPMDYDLMGGIRGNGKTASMTLLLKKLYFDEGWTVYTNYTTSFSALFSVNEDIEDLFQTKISKAVIGIDELSLFANSYDRLRGKKPGTFLLEFIKQSRKKACDFLFTDQRFKEIHKRLRFQTDDLLIATKYHYDGKTCEFDRCRKDHFFTIESINYEQSGGEYGFPPLTFPQSAIIDLYDTNEVVH